MQTSPPDVTPAPLPESCPRCGGALDPTREECPRCLLGLGLAASGTEEPVPSSTGAGPRSAGPPPTLEEVRAAFPALAVEALLGQGGMGAVFRARQPRLERTIALKVLPRALGADPSFAERFAREARALARLAHPGIVAVHDFGCADGLHYLVMEFVDGVNLRELLRRGPLEPRQALAIARELCDALQYAHDEGVVHRDVKPENVLVDARGRVKVADFGLAKLVDALAEPGLTRSDQVMGTPHYMAPEQLERPLEVDHRADLFALGVVLYEMLTGSLPRGKFEPPSRRVEVDVRLDEIVLKALEHEPTRRYQQALEIKTDVEHLPAGGERAPAPPRTEPGPAARPPRAAHASRSRTHGWRAGVLFLLAWILLGLSWNLGPFAFGLGTLLVVAACAHLLRERVQAVPEWSAALARAPDRRGRGFALGVGGLLCVGAIAHGHVLHWEQGVHTWRPTPPGGGDALFERWGREPWALLRLATAGGDVTRTVPAESEPRLVLERNLSSVPPGGGGLAWTLILGGIVGLGLVLALAVRVAGQPGLAR
ncbi:MAG TPA: serine/threonine-protein kinase, partial [Planctomycetota bacterium]